MGSIIRNLLLLSDLNVGWKYNKIKKFNGVANNKQCNVGILGSKCFFDLFSIYFSVRFIF